MTARTTAEIVADLREWHAYGHPYVIQGEAADRLTELDAEGQVNGFTAVEWYNTNAVHKEALRLAEDELNEALASRAELDALVAVRTEEREVYRNAQISVERELNRIKALRPPCPTCDGGDNGTGLREECPDCVDGKVSIEQLAATWRAVWDDANIELDGTYNGMDADYLRAVRP